MLVTSAALGVLLLILALLALWSSRFRLRRRVLVNLVDGSALNAVLWRRGWRLLVLRDVTLLERGAEPTAMDGEVLVDRARVAFVQVTG